MLFALVNSGVISGSDLFVNIGSISLFN
jgi:hypothetical protein